jgi:hypothetical protein
MTPRICKECDHYRVITLCCKDKLNAPEEYDGCYEFEDKEEVKIMATCVWCNKDIIPTNDAVIALDGVYHSKCWEERKKKNEGFEK